MLKAKGKQFSLIFKTKKMQTKKMNLANIQGKLSRTEMKNIMAGKAIGVPKCDTCGHYLPLCCYTTVDCCINSSGACCNK